MVFDHTTNKIFLADSVNLYDAAIIVKISLLFIDVLIIFLKITFYLTTTARVLGGLSDLVYYIIVRYVYTCVCVCVCVWHVNIARWTEIDG